MENKRNPARPHQCLKCLKSFLNKNDLIRHDVTHTKEKPHKCTICDKKYGLKCSLKSHAEVHILENEKKFACAKCGKKFGFRVSLNRHINARTKSTRKEHNCFKCGQTFHNQCLLEHHIYAAHPDAIQCQRCGKVFALKRSLRKHNNKKFSCSVKYPELEPLFSSPHPQTNALEFTETMESNLSLQMSKTVGSLRTHKNKSATHPGLESSSMVVGTTPQVNVKAQASCNNDSWQKTTETLESKCLFQLSKQISNQNKLSVKKPLDNNLPTMKCFVCRDEPGFKGNLVDRFKPQNMGMQYMCPNCDINLESSNNLDEYFRKASIIMHNW